MLSAESNHSDYWREFDKVNVSHSAAHYLMTIDALRKEFGYARATDIASRLDVSRGAVSIAVSQLKKRKLVKEDPHRFLLLTEKGKRVVKHIEQNFRVLASFFEEILGVSPKVARVDACKMEHLLSLDTGRRLVWIMQHILSDPRRSGRLRDAMRHFSAGCDADAPCPLAEDFSEGPPCQVLCERPAGDSANA